MKITESELRSVIRKAITEALPVYANPIAKKLNRGGASQLTWDDVKIQHPRAYASWPGEHDTEDMLEKAAGGQYLCYSAYSDEPWVFEPRVGRWKEPA